MKKFKTVLIATVIAIALLGCTKEELIPDETDMSVSSETALKSTAKPAAKLMGEFYIVFAYNPDEEPFNLTWDGTISFEGSEEEYGYRFLSLGGRYPGQSFHFNEPIDTHTSSRVNPFFESTQGANRQPAGVEAGLFESPS